MAKAKKGRRTKHVVQKGKEDLEPGASPVPGLVVHKVFEHGEAVWYTGWSPDSKLLGTSSSAGTFVLDMETGQNRPLAKYPTNDFPSDICWSPDGRWIAVADGGNIRLLNSGDHRVGVTLVEKKDRVELFDFSPDGSLLVASYMGSESVGVAVQNVATGKSLFKKKRCCSILRGFLLVEGWWDIVYIER